MEEAEVNAIKIEKITARKPSFDRFSIAFADEVCIKIAKKFVITIISFAVVYLDRVPLTLKTEIEKNVLMNVKPVAFIIMNFNLPKWNTLDVMQLIFHC